MTRRQTFAVRSVVGVLLVITATACTAASAGRAESGSADDPAGSHARSPARSRATSAARAPTPDTPRYVADAPVLRVAAPARLEIPAIDVSTPLMRLGLVADGSLEVPTDFSRAGWYIGGPAPGESGPSVVAGHVDSLDGPAVFVRLADLRPGDEIRVRRVDGSDARFLVDRIERFAKQAFPTEAVFGPTAFPELRLVTCGGSFDFERRTYLENLVVFARLA